MKLLGKIYQTIIDNLLNAFDFFNQLLIKTKKELSTQKTKH